MQMPSAVSDILHRLTKAGYAAYLVGGCVRDQQMGRAVHDWDITTSALPDEVVQLFTDRKVIPTGIQHGTVTVMAEDQPVEVTTYRVDGDYKDHRHPRQVTFSRSLTDDLARRDFTFNAMAYHPDEGLVDPFGGQADLQARRLRCVGNPNRRFEEDALRLMRALRFASVLGCSIESNTDAALHRQADLLLTVAPERLYKECLLMLCGKNVEHVMLEYADVLAVIIPEIANMRACTQQHPCHIYDVYGHTVKSIAAAPSDPLIRLSMLFHDAGKPLCRSRGTDGYDHFYGHESLSSQLAERRLRALRADRTTVDTVAQLVSLHGADLPATRPAVRRWLNRLGPDIFERWLQIRRADILAMSPAAQPSKLASWEALVSLSQSIRQETPRFSREHLAVNGRDLIMAGFPPGKDMGRLLTQMLEAVMDDRLPNDRDALLTFAKQFKLEK